MYTYIKSLLFLVIKNMTRSSLCFFSLSLSIFSQNIYIVTHPSVANNYLFEVNSDFFALRKACNALGHNYT